MVVYNTKVAKRYRGKRYICLVRQSDDSYGTTSTEAQLKLLRAEGDRRGMIHIADVVLNGVSGSLPGNRNDLEELFRRKREHDDFDVLLVQRCDRLTRGGAKHGSWVEYEAERLGIEIVYVADDIPEDDRWRGMIVSAKFDAAQDQARSIGQRSVQGWKHAFDQGRVCVIARTPFGCDRIYFSDQGEPLFRIRNLGDDRQQKLKVDSDEVIDTYGKIGGGSIGHYRKQRGEKAEMCPGDPAKAEVVRHIFRQHYDEGWGGKRIADDLNRRGWRSPMGKTWSQRQVESIYENPVYCGYGLGSRMSQGIYYRRGGDGPEEIDLPKEVLANCRTAPRQYRPPDEWVWQEQPLMMDFLPDRLREKALAEIKKVLIHRYECDQDPSRKRQSTNRHKDSPYVLTGLLVAKQDGEALSGVLQGRKGKEKRKYRHLRGSRDYQNGSIYNNRLDAVALESAVLGVVAETLRDVPELRQRVEEGLKAVVPQASVEQELAELEKRRQEVATKTERVFMLAASNADATADVQRFLDQLRSERLELDQQIAEMRKQIGLAEVNPEAVVDAVVRRYESLNIDDLTSLSIPVQREILRAFIEKVEADMATRDVTITLKMPPWALSEGIAGVGLAHSSASSTVDETLVVRLAWADCEYVNVVGSQRPVTYRCRRRPAA